MIIHVIVKTKQANKNKDTVKIKPKQWKSKNNRKREQKTKCRWRHLSEKGDILKVFKIVNLNTVLTDSYRGSTVTGSRDIYAK